MPRVYATPDDLATYSGEAAPDDATALLAKATRLLVANVFRLCWYHVGDDKMPSDPRVTAAFRDAVCAQVQWWDELGDSTGAFGAGWGTLIAGSVRMARSVTDVSGEASPARQIAPEVWDCLTSDELTPDVLVVGLVIS